MIAPGGGVETCGLVLFAIDDPTEDLSVAKHKKNATFDALEAALVPLLSLGRPGWKTRELVC